MSQNDEPSALKKARNIGFILLILLGVLFAVFFGLDRAGVLKLPLLPHGQTGPIIGYTEGTDEGTDEADKTQTEPSGTSETSETTLPPSTEATDESTEASAESTEAETAVPSEPTSSATPDPRNLEATAADLQILGTEFSVSSLITALNATLMEGGYEDMHIDFRPLTETYDTQDTLFFCSLAIAYQAVYGRDSVYLDENDPIAKKASRPFYFHYSLEKLNRIAVDMLHLQPIDPATFRGWTSEGREPIHEFVGDDMFADAGFDLDGIVCGRIKEQTRLPDGSYRFTVEYAYLFMGEEFLNGTGTLNAAVRESDGERYWSILSYTAEKLVREW